MGHREAGHIKGNAVEKTHEHDWESCPGSGKFLELVKRKYIRCGSCNRRLLAKEIYGEGMYIMPRHKPKVKRKKRASK